MYIKIKNILKKNKYLSNILIKIRMLFYKSISFIPDETFLKWQYRLRMGEKLNLDNPQNFNEKIQWLKLYWQKDLVTKCADKYTVREYVKSKIGEEFLNPLINIYNHPKEINWRDLPDQFVLKTSHGWGDIIICKDKNKLNFIEIQKILKKNLKYNQYLVGREWGYKDITPRILCENLLSENGEIPKDYKIFCFNGKARLIQLNIGRYKGHQRGFYDLDWNPIDLRISDPKIIEKQDKPQNFNKMIKSAEILSEHIPFVRVDFYNISGKIIFGEMTFYPANGNNVFEPKEYNNILGKYIHL